MCFSRTKKIPALLIDPQKIPFDQNSSDQKIPLDLPSVKYVSGAPGIGGPRLLHWVVPENIRTPTTGGTEILPLHAFGNSKMLYPPHIRNSRLLYPSPLFRNSRRVFDPTLQNFLVFNLLTPPESFFFSLLKKCSVY